MDSDGGRASLLGLTGVIVAETKRYTAHLAKQKEKDSIAEEVAEEAVMT